MPSLFFVLGFETLFRAGLSCCPLFLFLEELPELHTCPSTQELASDLGFLTTVLCALGGFSLLLGLASCEQRLQRWTRPLSGLVWAALLALGHGFLFTGGVVSAWDQVRGKAGGAGERGTPGPQTRTQDISREQSSSVSLQLPVPFPQVSFFLFVIFTTYAMLPLGMRDATAAGLTSSLSHLLVLGLYLGPQLDSRPALLPQVSTHVEQAAPRAGLAGHYWVQQGIHQHFAEL